ncbi:hypothetical protein C1645_771000 [Glomus cerebriforme]|uniref:Protein kinase domain-containing protein n=1 Tax=Glomus cerebriforme TaxID=658196 RepID=A0A397SZC1_9GLOM|nr:hypothetical protein C1645_771000 [Glomus cerebriforme]
MEYADGGILLLLLLIKLLKLADFGLSKRIFGLKFFDIPYMDPKILDHRMTINEKNENTENSHKSSNTGVLLWEISCGIKIYTGLEMVNQIIVQLRRAF